METALAESTVETGAECPCSCPCVSCGKAFSDAKAAVSAKLEDGKIAATRFVRHARYVAEDGVEEAAHAVKRNPLKFLFIAFSVGAALGFLLPRPSRR